MIIIWYITRINNFIYDNRILRVGERGKLILYVAGSYLARDILRNTIYMCDTTVNVNKMCPETNRD